MKIMICTLAMITCASTQLEAVKDCPRCKVIEAERAKEPFKDAGYYHPTGKEKTVADSTWTPTDELHSSPINTGTGPNNDINPDIQLANEMQQLDFENENPSD